MIKGEVINGVEVARRLSDNTGKLRMGLVNAISRLALTLQRNVKADKLSGQVLNVRTGRLRRSINVRLDTSVDDKPAGYVGTNLKYARPHEYGFHGLVTVREHLRTQTKAWGKPITPVEVTVASHPMKVNLPERSFLRSALADMGDDIKKELRGAVTEAIK